MPSLDFLLRCLLLVALCLDGRFAPSMPNAAADPGASAASGVVASTTAAASKVDDCAKPGNGQRGGDHGDCDCAKGTCGCVCFLSVAALPAVSPSLLPHALPAGPLAWSAPHVPGGLRTKLFRPPIA
ncbi:MAG TPA: CopL family metal-binding regulatory protein [Tahibacter sp.]|nr:CopL family metal-binding regulatory protein [Tahibacter sp.]